MLNPDEYEAAKVELGRAVKRDMEALDRLRALVRELGRPVRIQPRRATSIALVGTDGGYNRTTLNPFLAQLLRVVDSSSHQYCMEVVSASTSIEELDRYHQKRLPNGELSPLKELMEALNKPKLADLSPVFKPHPEQRSNSWMQVYRQITEWAVLYKLLKTPRLTDTVFVRDGPLRTKVFPSALFSAFSNLLQETIEEQERTRSVRTFVAGITIQSNVLERYRLAMALEGLMRQSYPCYVQLTGKVMIDAINWIEYLSSTERQTLPPGWKETKDIFSMGQMYFVKFGSRPSDPVWVVDLLESQRADAATIFGYLLEDAREGFPTPLFPQCLQDARAHAALKDFDVELVSHEFGRHLRTSLGDRSDIVDELELQEAESPTRRPT